MARHPSPAARHTVCLYHAATVQTSVYDYEGGRDSYWTEHPVEGGLAYARKWAKANSRSDKDYILDRAGKKFAAKARRQH